VGTSHLYLNPPSPNERLSKSYRIGVYRSLGPEGQDTLHFDDFVASHSEEDVDKFLKNSRLERKN
jgi:hypothetical protein